MMKNTMKKTLVAAAIAALAMSGAANAAYFTGGATGNGDLTFSAWDSNAGVGYTFDLGVALNDLLGADNSGAGGSTNNLVTANSTSLISGIIYSGALTGFNTFLTAAGGTANTVWNLAAGDNYQRYRVLTTEASTATAADIAYAQKNGNISATAGYYSGYVTSVGGKVATAGDNFANTVATDYGAYAGATTWNTLEGGKGLVSGNALTNGSSANLFLLAQKSTTSANTSNPGSFAQVLDVNGKALTATVFQSPAGAWNVSVASVAAVPEADTSAMFLAGLGLMGFIARRRMQG